MPEVIDNVKVGVYIKEMLKKKNMTQDGLANILSISKSAVSQNLSGKSSFDIQNLMAISKLFNISLDQLLTQKSDEIEVIVSEYERLAKKGIEEVKKLGTNRPNIFNSDVYGKYLVEYVMLNKDVELFRYLDDSSLIVLDNDNKRVKDVLVEIILFMLENNMPNIEGYIFQYAIKFKTFSIEDYAIEKDVWLGIDRSNDEKLITSLFCDEYIRSKKVLKVVKYNKSMGILSNMQWVEKIAKYKLDYILNILGSDLIEVLDLHTIIKEFIKYEYDQGILSLIHIFQGVQMDFLGLKRFKVQEAFEELSVHGKIDSVTLMVQKEMYIDIQRAIVLAINSNQKPIYEFLYDVFHSELDFREICIAASKMGNMPLIENIIKHLSPDDMNIALASTGINDFQLMKYLISNGAEFVNKYYNFETQEKITLLLKKYISGKEE